MAIEISAQKREVQGTGASRRLHHQGMVPAILYGGDKEPVNLVLDHQALIVRIRDHPLASADGDNRGRIIVDRDEIHEWARTIDRRLEMRHVDDSVDGDVETGQLGDRF